MPTKEQVLQLLERGYDYRETATRLGIPPGQVYLIAAGRGGPAPRTNSPATPANDAPTAREDNISTAREDNASAAPEDRARAEPPEDGAT